MKLDRSDSMILTTQSKWKGKGRYSNNGNEDILNSRVRKNANVNIKSKFNSNWTRADSIR